MQVLRLAPLAQDDNIGGAHETAGGMLQAAAGSGTTNETARRTVPLPSILAPGAPTLMRAGVMPKPTPANLRRFAELPIARKAINCIKDRVAGMQWRIEPRRGRWYGAVDASDPALPPKEGGRTGHPAHEPDERQETHPSKTSLGGHPARLRMTTMTCYWSAPVRNPPTSCFRRESESLLIYIMCPAS